MTDPSVPAMPAETRRPPAATADPLPRIAFVGGGNMASALIGGLLDAGAEAGRVAVIENQLVAAQAIAERFHVEVSADTESILSGAEVVVLAVKPQQLAAVCHANAATLAAKLVISIAAGIRTADLSRWLSGHARIVRAMPNTPAMVRAGVTGLYAMPAVAPEERAVAGRLLAAVGSIAWVDEEVALDAVTAISGSGPAYVFHFIEGLMAAGEQLGLSPALARQLALDTVSGAAQLARGSDDPPAVLRARVTSPGGTTQAALAVFTQHDLIGIIAAAAQAASQRAGELGDQFGV